jgi:F420-dependent oxidoreductase-like protein
MLELAVMIEGQDGLNWDTWQRIARTAEDSGFVGLYRSDHFTNPNPPDIDSLECWASLAWLASRDSRLEFGPLVSPVSFRDPRQLVRMAAALDDVSGGRLHLGLGAGWQAREHEHWGFGLGSIRERFARLREALDIVSHLLRRDEPLTYSGTYYQVKDAVLLPRPRRAGGPRLVIGGNGKQMSLPLAARYADEWNAVSRTPAQYRELNTALDDLLREAGRQPAEVRRTMMCPIRFGRSDAQVSERLRGEPKQAARERGILVGTGSEIKDQVAELQAAGVQRIMLQWVFLDDVEGIADLGRALQ